MIFIKIYSLNNSERAQHVTIHKNFQRDANKFQFTHLKNFHIKVQKGNLKQEIGSLQTMPLSQNVFH